LLTGEAPVVKVLSLKQHEFDVVSVDLPIATTAHVRVMILITSFVEE